jgi:hypothetical protein
MKPLESPEKTVGIARIESNAVVTDKISLATVLLTAAKFNPGLVVG